MSNNNFFSRRKRKIIENVLVNRCGKTRKQARQATKSNSIVMTPENMPLASLTFLHETSFALWYRAIGTRNKPQPMLIYDEVEKTNTEDFIRQCPGMMTLRGLSSGFLESMGFTRVTVSSRSSSEDLEVQPLAKFIPHSPLELRFNIPTEEVICDCRSHHHITELGSGCWKCGSPITLTRPPTEL